MSVLVLDKMPDAMASEDRNKGLLEGRLYAYASLLPFDKLRDIPEWGVSAGLRKVAEQKSQVTAEDIRGLLAGADKYAIFGINVFADVSSSYARIVNEGKVAGEWTFGATSDGMLAPAAFGYLATIVSGDGIVSVALTYEELAMGYAAALPDLFEPRDGRWHWRSQDSPEQLFRLIESGDREKLPGPLAEMAAAWHYFLEHIKLR